MPYSKRECEICHNTFTPPHRATILSTGDNHLTHCAACRRVIKAANTGEPTTGELPRFHPNAAPVVQIVYDLETWGLDRGWGVTLVASFLIFNGNTVERKTLKLRDYDAWKRGERSNDKEFVEDIFKVLEKGHIGYAHNGEFFDVKWLRTVALKYDLQMPKLRLIDPAQIAWTKYRIGRNSLEAIADFLGLEAQDRAGQPLMKMHLSPDVWRHALLDDDDKAWKELVERCESDVELLNAVAGAVTRDMGMIDYKGSARG